MYLLISHLLIFSHLLNTCYQGKEMPLSFLCSISTSPSPELGSSSGVPTSTQTHAWTHTVPADNSPNREPRQRERGRRGGCSCSVGLRARGAAAALGRKAGRGGEACLHNIPANNAVERCGAHTTGADEERDVRERVLWRQGASRRTGPQRRPGIPASPAVRPSLARARRLSVCPRWPGEG